MPMLHVRATHGLASVASPCARVRDGKNPDRCLFWAERQVEIGAPPGVGVLRFLPPLPIASAGLVTRQNAQKARSTGPQRPRGTPP